MKTNRGCYRGHRFPPEVISHGVWLYNRAFRSLREVEDLLAKRGITVTHETIRQWWRKFGPEYAQKLRRLQGRLGDVWHLDEVFGKIGGEQYLSLTSPGCRGSVRVRKGGNHPCHGKKRFSTLSFGSSGP